MVEESKGVAAMELWEDGVDEFPVLQAMTESRWEETNGGCDDVARKRKRAATDEGPRRRRAGPLGRRVAADDDDASEGSDTDGDKPLFFIVPRGSGGKTAAPPRKRWTLLPSGISYSAAPARPVLQDESDACVQPARPRDDGGAPLLRTRITRSSLHSALRTPARKPSWQV